MRQITTVLITLVFGRHRPTSSQNLRKLKTIRLSVHS